MAADIRVTKNHSIARIYWVTTKGREWMWDRMRPEGWEKLNGYMQIQMDYLKDLLDEFKKHELEVEEL